MLLALMQIIKKIIINIKSKKPVLRFLIIFSLANSLIFCLIGIKYLLTIYASKTLFVTTFYAYQSILGKMFVIMFTLCAYIGHMSFLAFIPGMVLFPLALLIKNRMIVFALAIIVSTISILGLIINNIVYSLFHFHLNSVIMNLMIDHLNAISTFLELSQLEILLLILAFIIILLTELLLALLIWKKIILKNHKIYEKSIAATLFASLLCSYLIVINSIAANNNVFAQKTPTIPYYNHVLAMLLPIPDSFAAISRFSETRFSQPLFTDDPLNYPLKPLHCTAAKPLYNIVVIAIDAWRYDAVNPVLTPHIMAFAKKTQRFHAHLSGGNSTQAGLFSLFYSLPSNYWAATLKENRQAQLFKILSQYHYVNRIYFSSEMIPPFQHNVFAQIPDVRTSAAPGKTIPDRDRYISQEFIDFLTTRSPQQPFFAFLLYDAAHGFFTEQNFKKLYPVKEEQTTRLLALTAEEHKLTLLKRYLNAIHFIDGEIGKVLKKLEETQLLNNTIIIITSDHGEEFDDNRKNYWSHGSNYSEIQVKVPYMMYWPSQEAQDYYHQTSHYDIVPTILNKIFDCDNAPTDYSVGEDLYRIHSRPFLLVGSYINMAVLTQQRNYILQAAGNIKVEDKYVNELPQEAPDLPLLAQALKLMRQYYQKPN